jgi:hypothetical protein
MATRLFAHRVDQIKRAFDCGGPGDVDRNPRGAKDRADAAFAQARNVQAAFGVAMGEIEVLEKTSLRDVNVGIDNQRIEVEPASAARDLVSGRV